MERYRRIGLSLILVLSMGLAVWASRAARAAGPTGKELAARVFELRTYTANPGKFEDLHSRFRNHTNHLFVKHGMTLVGYWIPSEGPEAENTLIYLLAHENREAAKKSWAAFAADPDWQKAYTESHANGPLVAKVETKFLNPTDYSPLR